MNLQRKRLFERVLHGKENLEPVEPAYCIVYQKPGEDGVAVLHPDPNWLAMALAGGYLPPVEVYLQIRCEWHTDDGRSMLTDLLTNPGPEWKGGRVVNGHLLHTVHPVGPMSEEQAMEYLLQKDVPRAVWADHDRVNFPRFVITRRADLPKTRAFRNQWTLVPPEQEEAA